MATPSHRQSWKFKRAKEDMLGAHCPSDEELIDWIRLNLIPVIII
jgi:hypothetical protein